MRIPIIDLFSGPGGLSEGFARHGDRDWLSGLSPLLPSHTTHRPDGGLRFRIGLSVEKDRFAHQTLQLRAFFRQFESKEVPESYYALMRGECSEADLYAKFPEQAAEAATEAWNATLGEEDTEELDRRIGFAKGTASTWVLIGGPPCQAYSLAGRSRNRGIADYEPSEDHRHFLYKEYLRIVAKWAPPIFVMENVKGLLSSSVAGRGMFESILKDLSAPGRALPRLKVDRGLEYDVVPFGDSATPASPKDYVLKMEQFGIPQARHRVILLGIRRDFHVQKEHGLPLPQRAVVGADQVLSGLPPLRSHLTGANDAEAWLRVVRSSSSTLWFKQLDFADPSLARRVEKAISRLRSPRAGSGSTFVHGDVTTEYAADWYCDPRIGGISNHLARPHMDTDLHRYFFAACFAQEYGRSPDLSEFPSALLPNHKNAARAVEEGGLFSDRFRVQCNGRPSTTVTSHISKDGHYYIHPDPLQCRSLTVREAARLQTFPDNYFFCGPRTKQFHQVGNAVPPLFAAQLAASVARLLVSHDSMGLRSTG